jgi:hypothetical protein
MLQACNFTFDQVGDHQSSISPTTSVDVPPFIDCPLRTIFAEFAAYLMRISDDRIKKIAR